MKKIISIVLIVFLIHNMVACNNKSKTVSTSEENIDSLPAQEEQSDKQYGDVVFQRKLLIAIPDISNLSEDTLLAINEHLKNKRNK